MYTAEIISLISWPVLIALSYFVVAWLLKKYDKKKVTKVE